MPLGLLKYGLSSEYPVEVDLPPPKDLKSHYDVVIIGGGGHGLATAYYLAKYEGITNIAVLEKSYLGGLSLIHISEPTRHFKRSRMPSSA